MIYAQKVRKKMLFALSLPSSSSLFEKTKTRLRGGVLLLLQKLSWENERKEGRKEGRRRVEEETQKMSLFSEIKMSPFFLTKLNKTLNKGVKKVGKKCVHFLYYLD